MRRLARQYHAAAAASKELGSSTATSGLRPRTVSAARSRPLHARGYATRTSARSWFTKSPDHGPASTSLA